MILRLRVIVLQIFRLLHILNIEMEYYYLLFFTLIQFKIEYSHLWWVKFVSFTHSFAPIVQIGVYLLHSPVSTIRTFISVSLDLLAVISVSNVNRQLFNMWSVHVGIKLNTNISFILNCWGFNPTIYNNIQHIFRMELILYCNCV